MATTTTEPPARLSAVPGESAADEEAIAAANAAGDAEIPPSDPRRSIEELAAERKDNPPAEEEKPIPPLQLPLPGTLNTISSTVGGPKPTSSEARLLGGSLPIEGQFPLDDVVRLIVEVKVGSVEIVSTTDDWGNVKSVKRRHKMRMLSVKRFGE